MSGNGDGPEPIELALDYAHDEYPVFPCGSGQKRKGPFTEHGFKDATTDVRQINRWWKRHPGALIGMPTGAVTNTVVVDFDANAAWRPEPPKRAPKARTAHGGAHSYYSWQGTDLANSEDKDGSHIDVRAEGGYIILPGSRNGAGSWEWVGPYRLGDRGAMPSGLLTRLNERKQGSGSGNGSEPGSGARTRPVDGVAAGERPRHDVLRDAAASMIVKGVPDEAVLAGVIAVGRALGLDKDRGEQTFLTECRNAVASAKDKFEPELAKEVRRQRNREEARRILVAEKLGPPFPLPEVGRTLADALAEPRPAEVYTVDRMHVQGCNTLLVASYKTGKTTLCGNLVRSLVDGVLFLNEFEVDFPDDGSVAIFNYELTPDMQLDWLEDMQIENQEAIVEPVNLRGSTLRIWEPDERKRIVEWLKRNEVAFWLVDPTARAWRGLVTKEGDNVQIDEFLGVLDEIKVQAGVLDLLVTAHMGREKVADDEERARGGTRLEDWMDHGWYMGKDGQEIDAPRWFRVQGRGKRTGVDAVALDWEPGRMRYTTSGETRDERRQSGDEARMLNALLLAPGPMSYSDLCDVMEKNKVTKVRRRLEGKGLVSAWTEGRKALCELTAAGLSAAKGGGVFYVGSSDDED